MTDNCFFYWTTTSPSYTNSKFLYFNPKLARNLWFKDYLPAASVATERIIRKSGIGKDKRWGPYMVLASKIGALHIDLDLNIWKIGSLNPEIQISGSG